MKQENFSRVLATFALIGLLLFFAFKVMFVFIPFIFGFLLAYLVSPIVDRFAALGFRRDRVVLILYVSMVAIGVALGMWLLPSLYKEMNTLMVDIPSYTQSLNGLVDQINLEVQKTLKHVLGSKAGKIVIPFHAEELASALVEKLPSNIMNVAHFGLWVLIVPFVCYFGLAHGKQWINQIFEWTPSEYVEGMLGLMAELNARLGGYFRGVMWESICVGLLTIVGLLGLGVDGAVMIGTITGLVNVVPFLAPVVGGALAILAAYFQGKAVSVIVGILLLYLFVRLFDDFVLLPFIVGSSVHLHPLVMVFSVLAGIELAGFLGMVFAIPVAVIVKVVFMVFLKHRNEAVLVKQPVVFS